jgi:hypothetical protein
MRQMEFFTVHPEEEFPGKDEVPLMVAMVKV